MRRFRHLLILSLFLHGALLVFFARSHRATPRLPALEALVVDLEPLDKKENDRTLVSSPRLTNRGMKLADAPLPLSKFAPLRKSQLGSPLSPGEFHQETDPMSPFSASIDPFSQETVKTFGAYAWAHRQLQLGLGYPEAFRRNGISGQAEAHFSFNEAGVLESTSVRVKSDSSYLRVYVHRLIERTFAGSPVPNNLRKWKNSLELFCFVQFSLVESDTAVSLNMPTPIVGNRLFFARRSSDGKNQLDKLKWQAGPLHGFFPIPAVGVDMLWFARQAEGLSKQKTPADDLAPFREDPLFYN